MPIRKSLAAAAIAALSATAVGATAGPAAAAPSTGGPLATYIVTLDSATAPSQGADRAARLGGRIEHVYSAPLRGYAVRLPSGLAARLSTLPGVAALYLAGHPGATPAAVSGAIKSTATPHVVRTGSRYKTANNNLLFTPY